MHALPNDRIHVVIPLIRQYPSCRHDTPAIASFPRAEFRWPWSDRTHNPARGYTYPPGLYQPRLPHTGTPSKSSPSWYVYSDFRRLLVNEAFQPSLKSRLSSEKMPLKPRHSRVNERIPRGTRHVPETRHGRARNSYRSTINLAPQRFTNLCNTFSSE